MSQPCKRILWCFHWNYIVTCVLYNIKISFYYQFWIWISNRSTLCNWTVDDPIFALLHLFFAQFFFIFSTYFLRLIVLICVKWFSPSEIIFSIDGHVFLRILVINLGVLCFDIYAIYPLCVHRIIKVDSILYQKFTLWTYSSFRHEVSLLYLSRNNWLRVLTYVCRHCNIKYF